MRLPACGVQSSFHYRPGGAIQSVNKKVGDHQDDEHEADEEGAVGEGVAETPGINLVQDLGGHHLGLRRRNEDDRGDHGHGLGDAVGDGGDDA